MTALIVVATFTTAGLILDLAARFWDRANARRDAAHAAELAAAHTSLGTLLPGPSETPVGDLAAKVVGL